MYQVCFTGQHMSCNHLIYHEKRDFPFLGLRVPLGPQKGPLGSYFGFPLFKKRFLAQFYPYCEDVKVDYIGSVLFHIYAIPDLSISLISALGGTFDAILCPSGPPKGIKMCCKQLVTV